MIRRTAKRIKNFFVFLAGNSASFWVQLGLTFLFTEYLNLYYIFSYALALILVTAGLFFYNEYLTFHKKLRKWFLSLVKFVLLTVGIYIPNIIIVYFLTNWINHILYFVYNYLIIIALVSIPYSLLYFFLSEKLFKSSP